MSRLASPTRPLSVLAYFKTAIDPHSPSPLEFYKIWVIIQSVLLFHIAKLDTCTGTKPFWKSTSKGLDVANLSEGLQHHVDPMQGSVHAGASHGPGGAMHA